MQMLLGFFRFHVVESLRDSLPKDFALRCATIFLTPPRMHVQRCRIVFLGDAGTSLESLGKTRLRA